MSNSDNVLSQAEFSSSAVKAFQKAHAQDNINYQFEMFPGGINPDPSGTNGVRITTPECLYGKVVKVYDGDTFDIELYAVSEGLQLWINGGLEDPFLYDTASNKHIYYTVRLVGIDCAELKSTSNSEEKNREYLYYLGIRDTTDTLSRMYDLAEEAKAATAKMVLNKMVVVWLENDVAAPHHVDTHGRLVGCVYVPLTKGNNGSSKDYPEWNQIGINVNTTLLATKTKIFEHENPDTRLAKISIYLDSSNNELVSRFPIAAWANLGMKPGEQQTDEVDTELNRMIDKWLEAISVSERGGVYIGSDGTLWGHKTEGDNIVCKEIIAGGKDGVTFGTRRFVQDDIWVNNLNPIPAAEDEAELSSKGYKLDLQDIPGINQYGYVDTRVRIGDTILTVPPLAIRVRNVTQSTKVNTLRNNSSMQTQSGYVNTVVEMELFFHDLESINGIEIPNPFQNADFTFKDGVPPILTERWKNPYAINGLRSLIAQFKKAPFLPIYCEYLEDAHEIGAVALESINVSTVPGFPNCLMATLVMTAFDWNTYLIDCADFGDKFNWPIFRWYYQHCMQPSKNNKGYDTFTYLPAIGKDNTTSDKISFYIADEGVLAARLWAIKEMRNYISPLDFKEQSKDKTVALGQMQYDGITINSAIDQANRFKQWIAETTDTNRRGNAQVVPDFRCAGMSANDPPVHLPTTYGQVYHILTGGGKYPFNMMPPSINRDGNVVFEQFAGRLCVSTYLGCPVENFYDMFGNPINLYSYNTRPSPYQIFTGHYADYLKHLGKSACAEDVAKMLPEAVWAKYFTEMMEYVYGKNATDYYFVINGMLPTRLYDLTDTGIAMGYALDSVFNNIAFIKFVGMNKIQLLYDSANSKITETTRKNIDDNPYLLAQGGGMMYIPLYAEINSVIIEGSKYVFIDIPSNEESAGCVRVVAAIPLGDDVICAQLKRAAKYYDESIQGYSNFINYMNKFYESDESDLPMLLAVTNDKTKSSDPNYNTYFMDAEALSVDVTLENVFATQQLQEMPSPTIQYLGSQDGYINIVYQTNNMNDVKALQRLFSTSQRIARDYRIAISSAFLGIENSFINMMGINHCLVDRFEVSTIAGFPGSYSIALALVAFDKSQRRREELANMPLAPDMDEDTTVMDYKLQTSTAKKEMLQRMQAYNLKPNSSSDDVIKRMPFLGLFSFVSQNDDKLKSAIFQYKLQTQEVYPDLELPTWEEFACAIPYLNCGIKSIEEYNDKLQTFTEAPIAQARGKYVDPDFYIKCDITFSMETIGEMFDNNTKAMLLKDTYGARAADIAPAVSITNALGRSDASDEMQVPYVSFNDQFAYMDSVQRDVAGQIQAIEEQNRKEAYNIEPASTVTVAMWANIEQGGCEFNMIDPTPDQKNSGDETYSEDLSIRPEGDGGILKRMFSDSNFNGFTKEPGFNKIYDKLLDSEVNELYAKILEAEVDKTVIKEPTDDEVDIFIEGMAAQLFRTVSIVEDDGNLSQVALTPSTWKFNHTEYTLRTGNDVASGFIIESASAAKGKNSWTYGQRTVSAPQITVRKVINAFKAILDIGSQWDQFMQNPYLVRNQKTHVPRVKLYDAEHIVTYDDGSIKIGMAQVCTNWDVIEDEEDIARLAWDWQFNVFCGFKRFIQLLYKNATHGNHSHEAYAWPLDYAMAQYWDIDNDLNSNMYIQTRNKMISKYGQRRAAMANFSHLVTQGVAHQVQEELAIKLYEHNGVIGQSTVHNGILLPELKYADNYVGRYNEEINLSGSEYNVDIQEWSKLHEALIMDRAQIGAHILPRLPVLEVGFSTNTSSPEHLSVPYISAFARIAVFQALSDYIHKDTKRVEAIQNLTSAINSVHSLISVSEIPPTEKEKSIKKVRDAILNLYKTDPTLFALFMYESEALRGDWIVRTGSGATTSYITVPMRRAEDGTYKTIYIRYGININPTVSPNMTIPATYMGQENVVESDLGPIDISACNYKPEDDQVVFKCSVDSVKLIKIFSDAGLDINEPRKTYDYEETEFLQKLRNVTGITKCFKVEIVKEKDIANEEYKQASNTVLTQSMSVAHFVPSDVFSDTESYQRTFTDMFSYDHRGRLLRAFPTFQMFLIDEGRWAINTKLWDNMYGYQAITSIDVVRDRRMAADTAVIQMTNLYSSLSTKDNRFRDPSWSYDLLNMFKSGQTLKVVTDFIGITTDEILQVRRQHIDSMMLKPGARIHLRIGYGSNACNLPIVFNGTISEVDLQEVVTIVAQGDGIELCNKMAGIENTNDKGFMTGAATVRETICEIMTSRGSWFKDAINLLTQGLVWRGHPFGIAHFGQEGKVPDALLIPRVFRGPSDDFGEAGANVYSANGDDCYNRWTSGSRKVQLDNTPSYITWGIRQLGGDPNAKTRDNKDLKIKIYKRDKTPWDVFQTLAAACPDFICAVEPFELRSTLFFGRPNYGLAYKYGYLYAFSRDIPSDPNNDKSPPADPELRMLVPVVAHEYRKPFVQYHIFNSMMDIINNKIKATDIGMYTNVRVSYGGVSKDAGTLTETISLDDDIFTQHQKTAIVEVGIAKDDLLGDLAINYFTQELHATNAGASALADFCKNMYDGELVVMGYPSIKPHDKIYIDDTYNEMQGLVGVKRVIHHFSFETGFITSICPDCIAIIDDPIESARINYVTAAISGIVGGFIARRVGMSLMSSLVGKLFGRAFMRRPDEAAGEYGEGIFWKLYSKAGTCAKEEAQERVKIILDAVRNEAGEYKGIKKSRYSLKRVIEAMENNKGYFMDADAYMKTYEEALKVTKDVEKASAIAEEASISKFLKFFRQVDKIADVAREGGTIARLGGKILKTAKAIITAIDASTLVGLIASIGISIACSYLTEFYRRWLRYRQAVILFPVKLHGKALTAGINGHMGCVYGDPMGVLDKVLYKDLEGLNDFVINFLGGGDDVDVSARYRVTNPEEWVNTRETQG